LPGNAGVYVTLSEFTPDARDEAKRPGLTLIDGRELLTRIEAERDGEPSPTASGGDHDMAGAMGASLTPTTRHVITRMIRTEPSKR
jgi:hypothetical protein